MIKKGRQTAWQGVVRGYWMNEGSEEQDVK